MDETPITSDRKLWRAVLEQAYADAELSLSLDGSEPVERLRARIFLRANSSQEEAALSLVCEFADIPTDRVIPWARKRYPLAA